MEGLVGLGWTRSMRLVQVVRANACSSAYITCTLEDSCKIFYELLLGNAP